VVVLDPAVAGGDITLEELTLGAARAGRRRGRRCRPRSCPAGSRAGRPHPQDAAGSLVATTIGLVLAEPGEEGLGFTPYRYSNEERDLVLRARA